MRGAGLRNNLTGEQVDVEARITVSASGAWAGRVAEMAGIEGVHVMPGRGIMIAMNHRLVNTVVNRCQMPTDGDIIVPIRTVSVIGTTDVHTDDPDDHSVLQNEVDAMLDDGEKLVPGFRQARALRVWTGVRPLFEDRKEATADPTRDVTRAHALLDHRERDGVDGFVTITGGKLTTYRLMAAGHRRRGLPAAGRGPAVHDRLRAASRLRVRRVPAHQRSPAAPRGDPAGRPARVRVRADPALTPRGHREAARQLRP